MNCLKWAAVFICAILTYTGSHAQWNISVKKLHRSLVLDLMVGMQLPLSDTFCFFGPAFDLSENVKTAGYDLFAAGIPNGESVDNSGTDLVYKVPLPEKVRIARKNVFLYMNCYADNISEYNIGFEDDERNNYSKTFKVFENQYQIPFEVPLTQWRNTGRPEANDKKIPDDSITISNLFIRVKKNDERNRCSFVIGELELFRHQIQEESAKGCFFYQLTGDSANLSPSFTVSRIGNSYPMSTFTIFRDTYAQSFTLQSRRQIPDNELKDSTVKLLQFIISKYPYYKEHHLNKQRIASFLRMVVKSGIPFEKKIYSIDSLISTFSDGHFYLEKPATPYVSGPVHVRKINGRLQVIAVFDSTLHEKVKPGNELLVIDGIPADRYMKSVTARYYGGTLEKTNIAISRLLYKASNDSTTIEVSDNGLKKSVTYYYNRSFVVPDNFKPAHRKALVKDNIFYYRLNKWDPGDWLSFYNHREAIKKSSAIIFDLRGNSGGVEVEAFKMLSCFIKSPVTISKSSYMYNETSIEEGLNRVQPNQFIDLSGKRVVILTDNNTACASEIFTSTLRSYAGATVIGSEKTTGSYASGDIFYLPLNITMHVNILNKFSLNDRMGGSIEMKGIIPDIRVVLNSYKDLYPYEDKILKVAYEFLSKNNLAYH